MNKEIQDLITTVLEGKQEEINLPSMLPISEISDFLENKGFEELDLNGDETNGWQVDFWYTYTHKILGDFMITGSLFYGNFKFIKIEKDNA